MDDTQATAMDTYLLAARLTYIMENPATFLDVQAFYDCTRPPTSLFHFPSYVNMEGKIYLKIRDNTGYVFTGKTGEALLNAFRYQLEYLYYYFEECATNMDSDIVALLQSKEEIPLAYFYQGEYHLWEE